MREMASLPGGINTDAFCNMVFCGLLIFTILKVEHAASVLGQRKGLLQQHCSATSAAPAFGGFGAPAATPAPAFGGFGAPAASTASTGFGFGAPAATSAFGGFGAATAIPGSLEYKRVLIAI